jgi:hypothetical protein
MDTPIARAIGSFCLGALGGVFLGAVAFVVLWFGSGWLIGEVLKLPLDFGLKVFYGLLTLVVIASAVIGFRQKISIEGGLAAGFLIGWLGMIGIFSAVKF